MTATARFLVYWPWLSAVVIAVAPCSVFPNAAWTVRVWQSDGGLPNNTVTSIAQTSDGYLWIASPGPLAQFDGVNFEHFSPSRILPGYHQNARALLQARDGSLWMALARGPVLRVKAGAVQVFTNNLEDQSVLGLIEDGEGAVWINYRGGKLCRIKDGRVMSFSGNAGWTDTYGTGSLACDSKGRLWFAKSGRVGLFQDAQFRTLIDVGPPSSTTRLASARNGGVWICSDRRLFKYNDQHKTLEHQGTLQTDRPGARPTVMLEDRSGNIWIGTGTGGLFCHSPTGFEHVPTSHPEILSLAEDREGNLWVGTGGGGLNRVQPSTIRLENTRTGLPFEAVRSVCEDAQGVMWASTQNGLLVRRTTNGWSTVSTDAAWPGGLATCLASDPAGGVWAGTRNNRLHYFRDGRWTTWTSADGLRLNGIHALLVSATGDLWVGGYFPESLQRLRAGRWCTFPLPRDVKYVRALAEDTAGNIWIGTSSGFLLRITDDSLTDETVRTFGSLTSIRALHATADGGVWIACAGGGLGWISKEGRFARITAEQGLYDNHLSQVIADDRGWLWFAGDRGIFKARQSALEAVGLGLVTRVQSLHYGQDAGVPGMQANFGDTPGAIRSRDGRLWMPMRTGLAVVTPGTGRESLDSPPIVLKQLTVDEKVVAAYGSIMPVDAQIDLSLPQPRVRLPPRHHRLEFQYAAPSFSAPENVHFRYRLEGLDQDWVEAGTQRSASYSRLRAGDYRFRVQARTGGGPWNPGAAMALTVVPFFWQTWWFVGLSTLTGIATVGGAIRHFATRKLRRRLENLEREQAVERERARIAKDLHDDLGASLVQIALLSELAQSDFERPDQARGHIDQIFTAARALIRSLDEIVWAVNPANDTLENFLVYICKFAQGYLNLAGIRCRLDVPQSLPFQHLSSSVRHHLYLVVKEALHNIVKHAAATEVRLRLRLEQGCLLLVIEDNGKGFMDSGVSSTRSAARSGDGLTNMRKRLDEIGGCFERESRPGTGTTVSLCMPLAMCEPRN